jgi:AcrR family transcriptional regulator
VGAKLGQNNVKGERTRMAVLAAAAQVFAESGYRASSLAMVAQRAGVTQSGVLHHFKNKEQLLHAVLEEHEREDDVMIRGVLREDGLGVLVALHDALLRAMDDRVAVRLFTVLVAESSAVDHPGHDYMRDRYDRLRRRVVAALRAGVVAGDLRDDVDVNALATAFIALLDGVQLQWVYDAKLDAAAAFEAVAALLRQALVPGRAVAALAD